GSHASDDNTSDDTRPAFSTDRCECEEGEERGEDPAARPADPEPGIRHVEVGEDEEAGKEERDGERKEGEARFASRRQKGGQREEPREGPAGRPHRLRDARQDVAQLAPLDGEEAPVLLVEGEESPLGAEGEPRAE